MNEKNNKVNNELKSINNNSTKSVSTKIGIKNSCINRTWKEKKPENNIPFLNKFPEEIEIGIEFIFYNFVFLVFSANVWTQNFFLSDKIKIYLYYIFIITVVTYLIKTIIFDHNDAHRTAIDACLFLLLIFCKFGSNFFPL